MSAHDSATRAERLIAELEQAGAAHPALVDRARAVVAAVLELHAGGLARALELLREREGGDALVAELSADPVVGQLLVLHELHPASLEERARAALASSGIAAVLVGVDAWSARITARVTGSGGARAAEALRAQLSAAVPDADVVVEAPEPDFVPASELGRNAGGPR